MEEKTPTVPEGSSASPMFPVLPEPRTPAPGQPSGAPALTTSWESPVCSLPLPAFSCSLVKSVDLGFEPSHLWGGVCVHVCVCAVFGHWWWHDSRRGCLFAWGLTWSGYAGLNAVKEGSFLWDFSEASPANVPCEDAIATAPEVISPRDSFSPWSLSATIHRPVLGKVSPRCERAPAGLGRT